MKKVPASVISAYRGRILNIHPALLPRFGGQGMYGTRVHEAVLAAGERESGATVHLVDEEYDRGAILLQRRVPVLPGDTPASLAARVLEAEHQVYPEALRRFAATTNHST
jgi:phosphoribosylglycinamide formyltransferase-1